METYDFDKRVEAFDRLGQRMRQFGQDEPAAGTEASNAFTTLLEQAEENHPFFTPPYVRYALREWGSNLRTNALRTWLEPYRRHFPLAESTVLLVMAGNLPLVGFHDYLCGLMAGCNLLVKLSSKDTLLLPFFHQELRKNAPLGSGLSLHEPDPVRFVAQIPDEGFHAVIATGNNHSHAFFSRQFHHLPHLLRHSRHACALLQGNESPEELQALADDILLYFGMGCRSVSKLYVPENYDFQPLIKTLAERGNNHKNNTAYMHAYASQKALMTVNGQKFLDTGFLSLVENASLENPLSVLHYETYRTRQEAEEQLSHQQENLQCVVGAGHLPFGIAQHPALADYADGADTLAFLCDFYQDICKAERKSYLCAPKNRN
ncbi:MAG: hypothetical protein K2M74_01745, partial [Bacteroidales bacterium]|nr:hypothetical protein [Bacteroidales bacterium]